jgi:hypothetical protein
MLSPAFHLGALLVWRLMTISYTLGVGTRVVNELYLSFICSSDAPSCRRHTPPIEPIVM